MLTKNQSKGAPGIRGPFAILRRARYPRVLSEHVAPFFATLSLMKAITLAFLAIFLAAATLFAAGLDTPNLSPPLATARFFDADRFLTTAGVKYVASRDLTLEPELGLGYHARETELHEGVEQSTHRLHAQAGWRLSLAESFYLSAGAKLPVVSVEKKGLSAGEELGIRPDVGTRTGYDFINPSRTSVGWTGEVSIRLLPRADLMLYYDQNPLDGSPFTRQHEEERIGTRFIIRFQ